MKVLLLSAYDADSHKRWREGLVAALPDFQWTCLHLPARYFSWRIRGNSLTWSFNEQIALAQPYDVVVATSMVDLATLRGLVPNLATTPAVLYCHENQFAYPVSTRQHHSLEPQMVTLYAALSAESLVFNSEFNRETFLEGVGHLLAQMPDHVPAQVPERLRRKSQVLPVPLEEHWFAPAAAKPEGDLQVVWNHRWEYDKGPQCLLRMLEVLPPDLALTLHIVGQQFRQSPPEFADIHALLDKRGWLGRWGYLQSAQEYGALLRNCHVVLSTALHDFQGLAVLDAVACGCVPLVPDRLAYRELFAPQFRYESDEGAKYAVGSAEIASCAARLAEYARSWHDHQRLPAAPSISALSWSALAPGYRQLLESTAI